MNHLAIVIPTLEPGPEFLQLLATIRASESEPASILVVDDGSGPDYAHFFEEAKHDFQAIVLTHETNLGKGRALKTAFQYLLEECPEVVGAITIDSDGQHTYPDMVNVGRTFLEQPNSLVLGVRYFSNEVPIKSRVGNIATRNILKLLTGIDLSDTQTGLRAIPRSFFSALLITEGERFEYELNMLIDAQKAGIALVEVLIATIYVEENAGTHFRAIADSLAIYKVFGKFILSSLGSFLVDILVFTFLMYFFKEESGGQILLATVIARILSSGVNYWANRQLVFQEKGQRSVFKYYLLVVVQMLVSAELVRLFNEALPLSISLVKVFVDFTLFLLNYQIQKRLIFRGKGE